MAKSSRSVGSRRQIRGKVLQALYAWYTSGNAPEEVYQQLLATDFGTLSRELPATDPESDAYFLRELFFACVRNRAAYEALLTPHLQNWEWSRVATVDRVILVQSVAELLTFAAIPPRVTLNEALELAKTFSTDKSNVFVNGILDATLAELRQNGQLQKTGKGLIDTRKPGKGTGADSD
ncbi:MAG: transcription antitermination factor NusB [Bacteroidia bacterium]|nr:transcription antitermination factor NusB [Bacteroidia bacterium]